MEKVVLEQRIEGGEEDPGGDGEHSRPSECKVRRKEAEVSQLEQASNHQFWMAWLVGGIINLSPCDETALVALEQRSFIILHS